jgi:cation:H+ antiporter
VQPFPPHTAGSIDARPAMDPTMLLDLVLLATGLGLLLLGGEWLVRGAVALAGRFGLPPLLIGLTVVGFGTSMPELLVSLQAARVGSPDIAVGNVVGSNIANILLILGVAAVISPVAARIPGLNRDLLMMTAVAVLTLALGWFGLVSRVFGFAMVAVLLVYLTTIYLLDRNNPQEDQDDAATDLPLWRTLLSLFGGLAGLFIGADLLVDTATKIARDFGISEAVIGLTIVAIGTSLPELATSVVAAFRKQSQVALGNVVGSNIFNILAILGITAIIIPVPIAAQISGFDIPLMLAVTVFIAALIFVRGRIDRIAGIAMLMAYGAYMVWLY